MKGIDEYAYNSKSNGVIVVAEAVHNILYYQTILSLLYRCHVNNLQLR